MPSAADLADANVLAALREHARWQQPCECREADGLLLIAGPNPAPMAFRNCVARIDPKVSPSSLLARAREFFSARKRGFAVVARMARDADLDAALLERGIAPTGDSACMLLESPLPPPAIPDGVVIERFSTARHVDDAVRVNAEAYEAIKLPAAETRLFFGRREALLEPRVAGFVAYRGGAPVSTALAILSGEGAGVYWVGTVRSAERQGLGAVMTALAANAGFAAGATVVTLQASVFGQPLYERLGFRAYDCWRRYRIAYEA